MLVPKQSTVLVPSTHPLSKLVILTFIVSSCVRDVVEALMVLS